MKIKKCMAFLAITCMSVMLAGCTSGGTQGSGDPGTETAQTDANTDEGSGQDAAQEDDNAGTDASGMIRRMRTGRMHPAIRTAQRNPRAM